MESLSARAIIVYRSGAAAFAAAQLMLRPPGDIESVPKESARADTNGQVYEDPVIEAPEPQFDIDRARGWSYNLKRVRHL